MCDLLCSNIMDKLISLKLKLLLSQATKLCTTLWNRRWHTAILFSNMGKFEDKSANVIFGGTQKNELSQMCEQSVTLLWALGTLWKIPITPRNSYSLTPSSVNLPSFSISLVLSDSSSTNSLRWCLKISSSTLANCDLSLAQASSKA